jgi:putative resolvase
MPGGKRLYNIEQTRRMFDGVIDNNTNSTNDNETQEKKCYCYCRVSSSKQEEDLKRQVEDCKQDYPGYEIIQDIGSGLNYKRKGLQTLLERVNQGMVQKVVVRHRDRLCRFGFELLEFIFQQKGVQLLVHSKGNDMEDDTQELADDLIAITNFFVARANGKRSASNRRERKRKAKEMEGGIAEEGTKNDHITQKENTEF